MSSLDHYPDPAHWGLDSDSDRENGPDDHVFISSHLDHIAHTIFTSHFDLRRLREASGLRSTSTPPWATHSEFSRGIFAYWGVAAEALALMLYHLAAVEGMSGKDVEKYRDVAEFYWRSIHSGNRGSWRREGDTEWFNGNPATAAVVCRAVNLAYDISDERVASGLSPGSMSASQESYREHVRRASQTSPWVDI